MVDALAGTPARVPLGGEPQGEAVAFEADGTLVSGSESRGGAAGRIREVPGAASLAGTARPAVQPPAAPVADPAGRAAWLGAAALTGVLVLGAAAMAVHGARRRRR